MKTRCKEPCEDAISRQAVLDLIVANHTELNGVNVVMYSPLCKDIKQLQPVTPQPKHCTCTDEDIAKAFQFGVAFGFGKRYDEMDRVIDEIKKVITPQPKTGHWSRKIKVDAYDIAGVKTWGIKCQCDRCDFTTIVVEDFGYYKYCPNCGARMFEPQAESEDKE